MLSVQRPARMPHEAMSGQCRAAIPGRADNIPRCMPPISELVTHERKRAGRLGHFSSRQPLLGVTPDQEGSVPEPMPSTQAMFPGPMPAELYNHRRDVVEHEDWRMVEQPMLAMPSEIPELARRIHQDRGTGLEIEEIGEPELTSKAPHHDWPFRPVPTDRNTVDLRRGGAAASLHQANIPRDGDSGRQSLVRTRRGGEPVNNRGGGAPSALVNNAIGIQRDTKRSLQFDYDASGAPGALNQVGVVIDPRTFRPRDTRRVFRTAASGNAQSLVSAPGRLDEGFFVEQRYADTTTDTHVSFGPTLRHDSAADRFQKRRSHIHEFWPEMKTGPTNEINNKGPKELFERPPLRGREHRVTQKDSIIETGRDDSGMLVEALRSNPYQYDQHHFYGKLQAKSGTAWAR